MGKYEGDTSTWFISGFTPHLLTVHSGQVGSCEMFLPPLEAFVKGHGFAETSLFPL